jgi:carboxymethylenebutenolidase
MGDLVTFPSNGSSADGYLAIPASGSGPGVIVIQEWWGLVGHIKSVADRFAAEGFVALAPDLFHGATTVEPDEAQKLMMGMAIPTAAKDIAGAADYLADRPECTGKVGTVGFCMGGSLALWSGTLSDTIRVTVGFYPAMPWHRMEPNWDDYTGKIAVLHTDEHEGGCNAEGPQTAKKLIEAAGGECACYEYAGTDHAFFNDDRPEVYHEEAAKVAWARTLEAFRTHLA